MTHFAFLLLFRIRPAFTKCCETKKLVKLCGNKFSISRGSGPRKIMENFKLATFNVHQWVDASYSENVDRVTALIKVIKNV